MKKINWEKYINKVYSFWDKVKVKIPEKVSAPIDKQICKFKVLDVKKQLGIFSCVIFTILVLLCFTMCSGDITFRSKKWRMDNTNLTEIEREEFSQAIQYKTEVESRDSYEALSGDDWTYLLVYFPELANKITELKRWGHISTNNWATLLASDVRFEKQFNKHFLGNGYSFFGVDEWLIILKKQPNLIKKADKIGIWKNLEGKAWAKLILVDKKDLIKRCDKNKGWNKLSVNDWIVITIKTDKHRDKFFKYVNSKNLTKKDWIKLFSQYIEGDLSYFLSMKESEAYFKLKDKIRETKDSLLSAQYEKECSEIIKVEKYSKEFSDILIAEAKKNNLFTSFSTKEILISMKGNSIFKEELLPYLKWEKVFDTTDPLKDYRAIFFNLIVENPSLLEQCPLKYLESITKGEWLDFLSKNYDVIKYADKINIWNKLDFSEWSSLLKNNQKYVIKFIENKPWELWDINKAKDLWNILIKDNPDSVELKKIAELQLHAIEELLRPKKEWLDIIIKDPKRFRDFAAAVKLEKPKLIDGQYKYSDSKNVLSSEDWTYLILNNLEINDLYADEYKIWDLILDASDTFILAVKYQQFVEKLRNPKLLKRFSPTDWDILITTFPQFLELYKKTKRNTSEWLDALINNYDGEKEYFIAFEAYKSFDNDDFIRLLKKRPEILEYYYNTDFVHTMMFDHDFLDLEKLSEILYGIIKDKRDIRAFAMLSLVAKPIGDKDYNHAIFAIQRKLLKCYFYMAKCYENGLCVEKDLEKAKYYYYLYDHPPYSPPVK